MKLPTVPSATSRVELCKLNVAPAVPLAVLPTLAPAAGAKVAFWSTVMAVMPKEPPAASAEQPSFTVVLPEYVLPLRVSVPPPSLASVPPELVKAVAKVTFRPLVSML